MHRSTISRCIWTSRTDLWLSSQNLLQKGTDLRCSADWALLLWLYLASSSLISILLRQTWWIFTVDLFVRAFSSLGRTPDLEWRRAEIDNGAAKWPLSCRRETWRKLLRGMKHPSLLSLWSRLVRMRSVRVLTEEDMARPKIHGHNLTPCVQFKGWVPGPHKLCLARSC